MTSLNSTNHLEKVNDQSSHGDVENEKEAAENFKEQANKLFKGNQFYSNLFCKFLINY